MPADAGLQDKTGRIDAPVDPNEKMTKASKGAETVAEPADRASNYEALFQPLRIRNHVARNRTMRTATTSHLTEGHVIGKRQIEFYRTVARGGVGVIVTEGLRIHPMESDPAGCVLMWDRASIPGMRKLAKAVKKEGALLIGQLNHGGRQHLGRAYPGMMVAPSEIACPRSGGIPHALTLKEVNETIEWFVTSAMHCIEAGMHGVELHGAQGHLVQQFFSPYSNNRTDMFGGSFENRARFASETLRRIRQRVGNEPIIGYRMGVEEFTEGGITLDEAKKLAAYLKAEGLIDYISLSQGNFNSKDTHLPDRHYPMVPYRSLQAEIKPQVGDLPVVMCTRVQTAEQANDLVASGEADMVGFCRAFIVDPAWPKKAEEGRDAEIRRCIACNQCWGWISEGGPIGCAINPVAGQEYRWKKLGGPAHHRRKVLVIGGGPGGMEAARIAADRGHDVTLIEREAELGGRVRRASQLPSNGELAHVTQFLTHQLKLTGVKVITGKEATLEDIQKFAPDEVVIATGAEPQVPSFKTDGSVAAITADGPLPETLAEGRIVVFDEDGYFWPAAVTEAAAHSDRPVTFVSRYFEPFRELPAVTRISTLRELDKLGVEFLSNHEIARIENGAVVLRHYQSGREERIEGCGTLIATGVQSARSSLFTALTEAGFDDRYIHLIGDAFAPRRLPNAIREGHEAGRTI